LRGDAMDRDFMPYQRVWLVQTCVTWVPANFLDW
jgi:hypothetical protein